MSDQFDPQPYINKIQGRDYLNVAGRIKWFRTEHGEAGKIETSVVHVTQDWCVCHARATIVTGGVGEGIAQEFRSNFADHVEKASTSAIGRALGALGYGTNDLEFDEGHIVDTPRGGAQQQATYRPSVEAGYGYGGMSPAPQASNTLLATANQIKFAGALATERGLNLSDEARRVYGKSPSELDRQQMSQFIDKLKDTPKAAPNPTMVQSGSAASSGTMNDAALAFWSRKIQEAGSMDDLLDVHDKIVDRFGGISEEVFDMFEHRKNELGT